MVNLYSVAKKNIATPSAATNLEYNGSSQTGVASGNGYTVESGSATNAGDYTATVKLSDTANTQWADTNNTNNKSINWSIAKKTITVTATDATRKYGANNPSFSYTHSDAIAGQTVAFDGNLSTTASNTSNVGTYKITQGDLKLKDNSPFLASNYSISFNEGTLTITKADGYINLTTTTGKVELETERTTFTIKNHHGGDLSATTTNGSVSVSGLNVTVSGLASVAGGTTVTITVKCAANTNYTEATATYKLEIENSVPYSRLKVGDYVSNYPYEYTNSASSITSVNTYPGGKTTTTYRFPSLSGPLWRILFIDEENKIVTLVSSGTPTDTSNSKFINKFTDTYKEGEEGKLGDPKVSALSKEDVEKVVGVKIRNKIISFRI